MTEPSVIHLLQSRQRRMLAERAAGLPAGTGASLDPLEVPRPTRVKRKAVPVVTPSSLIGKILDVAKFLPQPFERELLIVEVWRKYPLDFGMKGYPYPNTNKVLTNIFGSKGLIQRGFLEQTDDGLWRVKQNNE